MDPIPEIVKIVKFQKFNEKFQERKIEKKKLVQNLNRRPNLKNLHEKTKNCKKCSNIM